jgi:hypothetical protein
MERREMCTKFWSVNLKGIDHLKDLGIDTREVLEYILEECNGNVWIGFIWLKLGRNYRH